MIFLLPYLLLFIGVINVGPEFEAEFVDFHAGPMSVFGVTLFIYVETLQLHLRVFRLCCGFVTTFVPCLRCMPFVKFFVTNFMNVAT